MNIKKIREIRELERFSQDITQVLAPPFLVLLRGPVGVGKSEMVYHLLEIMGVSKKEAHSPSYSLMNIYKGLKGDLYHLDFFRLKSKEELDQQGFWDIFQTEVQGVFIEWPERLQEGEARSFFGIPDWNILSMDWRFIDQNSREIRWELSKRTFSTGSTP